MIGLITFQFCLIATEFDLISEYSSVNTDQLEIDRTDAAYGCRG